MTAMVKLSAAMGKTAGFACGAGGTRTHSCRLPVSSNGPYNVGTLMQQNDTQAGAMTERLDEYAAIAVRIYERIVRDGGTGGPPLTVGDPSIRVEGERSKKQKPENIG